VSQLRRDRLHGLPPLDSRGAWEVRVRFDDGTRATLRYPTDPDTASATGWSSAGGA
jgi:hypothetical protein